MADIHSLQNVDFQIHCGTNSLLQDADGLCSVVSQGRKDKEPEERQKLGSSIFLLFGDGNLLISYYISY